MYKHPTISKPMQEYLYTIIKRYKTSHKIHMIGTVDTIRACENSTINMKLPNIIKTHTNKE